LGIARVRSIRIGRRLDRAGVFAVLAIEGAGALLWCQDRIPDLLSSPVEIRNRRAGSAGVAKLTANHESVPVEAKAPGQVSDREFLERQGDVLGVFVLEVWTFGCPSPEIL